MSRLRALAGSDARRVARDRFLVGCAVYVLFVALVVRLGLPWAEAALRARVGFELGPYVPLVTGYVAISVGTLLAGVIGAFLLLETRTARTLDALRVAPMSLPRYLGFEALLVYLAAVPLSLVTAALVGAGRPPLAILVGAALVGGLSAPIVALVVPAFARDEVAAFALLKLVSFVGFVPVGAYFLPEPWGWLGAVVPTYGPLRAWWSAAAGEPSAPWALAAGLGVGLGWLGAAFYAFRRAVEREG